MVQRGSEQGTDGAGGCGSEVGGTRGCAVALREFRVGRYPGKVKVKAWTQVEEAW